jgi:phage terminase large subunit-like protein
VFLLLGGRGAGKTRTAAELVRHWVESGQARRIGLIGATAADVRDTMIQGPSGILSVSPPWAMPRFEPSKRRLSWPNGAVAICLSSEEPERARGLQFDRLWADELCAWSYPERMYRLVLLALRIGTRPQAVVTTTPKPLAILRRLLEEPTTRLSRETTFANAAHLAPEFLTQITAL